VTIGEPTGEPVLVLHGSNGSGQTMLGRISLANCSGRASRSTPPKLPHRPRRAGAGKSSKPSNGLRMAFPKFTYDDQVRAQYRLLTEHLGVKHLKLVIGQSMGGMHAWMWGEMYPDFMDVLVPMGSQPVAMSGRNWVLRRMLNDAIKAIPPGTTATTLNSRRPSNTSQPSLASRRRAAPSRSSAGANACIGRQACRAAARGKFTADANDYIYAYGAARDYDPSPALRD